LASGGSPISIACWRRSWLVLCTCFCILSQITVCKPNAGGTNPRHITSLFSVFSGCRLQNNSDGNEHRSKMKFIHQYQHGARCTQIHWPT
jgi:hypothetical protein